MSNTFKRFALLLILLSSLCIVGASYADDLPVIVPDGDELPYTLNKLTSEQLNNVSGGDEQGLTIDLLDPSLSGQIYLSQYPFEAGESKYDYFFYMDRFGTLAQGTGSLPLYRFFQPKYNANGWTEGEISPTPTVTYQMQLFQSGKGYIGLYGGSVSFNYTDGVFRKVPTIIDGPYVTMVSSDDPTSMEIVWETDEPCTGKVSFGSMTFEQDNGESTKHAVKISGLTPGTEYEYYAESVTSDGRKVTSNSYTARTAPEKGQGPVTFAYASDARNTGKPGNGQSSYMGINARIMKKISASAYRKGADFMIFGGDEVWGLTTDTNDLSLQLKTWKQSVAGFWRTRPVYAGMGNHEFGWKMYESYTLLLDRWPYETESGEAVFASEFFNPTNGPVTSDQRRPSYDENVYHFQYGPVMVISFNNTYWTTSAITGGFDGGAPVYGGCPMGYLMDDQVGWIESTIENAENDPTVKFIFLFTHAPVFPAMQHAKYSTWWNGNNNVRAYTKNSETGELEASALGIIEMRNRFWKALAQSSKVAAVFTGDEHAYHRTLITSTTPVGVYPNDDTDGDGILDEPFSPNPEFTNPVWHITSGGGGAPYVTGLSSTPWEPEVFSSHYGYVLINVEDEKASLKFIGGPRGQVFDKVDDLMEVKSGK